MKAAVFHRYGPPEVLVYEDIEPLPVGPRDVKIRVKATALNFYDVLARQGHYKPNERWPHILGGDISGDVVEVGEGVKSVTVGQPVVVYAAVGCGTCEICLKGEPNCCVKYRYYGAHLWGGYAQLCVVPEFNVVPLYKGMNYAEAASINMTFLTSWHMLVTRANIRAGEDILVHAAGSGIGVAAVQIAKMMGLRVFGTAGTDEKCRKALELGADVMINYRKQDFYEEIQKLTGKRGVDVVFEHVGKDVWDRSIRSLVRMGRLVTCGGSSGYDVTTSVAHIFHKQLTIIGSNHGTKNELTRIVKCLEAGKLKPVIDRIMPLEDAARAHQMLEQREGFGKLVLEPPQ